VSADSDARPSHYLPESPNDADCTSRSEQFFTLQPVSGPSCRVFPLPTYSDRITSAVRSSSIVSEFDRMIEETAYHILKHGDILNRTDYDAFGRRLYDAYPCIAFPGTEPWVYV
jgi:hypothetical protein